MSFRIRVWEFGLLLVLFVYAEGARVRGACVVWCAGWRVVARWRRSVVVFGGREVKAGIWKRGWRDGFVRGALESAWLGREIVVALQRGVVVREGCG